jgi:hypothetical protein
MSRGIVIPMSAPTADHQLGDHPPSGLQAWLERSPAGRGVLSTLIVITLIAVIAVNLPQSDLRQQLLRPGQSYLDALGLDQNWALFAPNPRDVILNVYASVRLADGRTLLWRYPHDGALFGQYRDYRWRKWAEGLVAPADSVLWKPAAVWAATHVHAPAAQVRSVSLLEGYRVIEPPGVSPSLGPPRLRVIYRLRVVPSAGAGG